MIVIASVGVRGEKDASVDEGEPEGKFSWGSGTLVIPCERR